MQHILSRDAHRRRMICKNRMRAIWEYPVCDTLPRRIMFNTVDDLPPFAGVFCLRRIQMLWRDNLNLQPVRRVVHQGQSFTVDHHIAGDQCEQAAPISAVMVVGILGKLFKLAFDLAADLARFISDVDTRASASKGGHNVANTVRHVRIIEGEILGAGTHQAQGCRDLGIDRARGAKPSSAASAGGGVDRPLIGAARARLFPCGNRPVESAGDVPDET